MYTASNCCRLNIFLCNDAVGPPYKCPLDVVIVMDTSKSIGANFPMLKTFVSKLVGKLDINSGNTRVGIVAFGTQVYTTIQLKTYKSVAPLQKAIARIKGPKGGTGTDLALAEVCNKILKKWAGDRPNVDNVVIVITDGDSGFPAKTKVSKM